MKILHVYDFYAPGNSRNGFDLDRFLVARGHQVHALTAVGPLGPSDGAVSEGVTFHTYPPGEDLSTLGRYRHVLRANADRLESLQREHAYDLLLLNQPLSGAGALRARASRGVPRVYYFLSPWAVEWRIANPGAGALSRWLQGGLRRRIEARAIRGSQAVIVASAFMRGQLLGEHPWVDPSRVSIIPGAVDGCLFRGDGPRAANRAKFGLGEGPVIATVRRLVPRMGVDLLLRGAAAIPGAQVVVGGDGPLRGELEALAASLGVRARFLGYVPDEALPSLFRAADVVVLPTRALEGFGLVAIEAMACGTPVMGTPVGAIPEVLGPMNLLFREASPEAIAEGLRGFFARRDEGLGRRCMEYVASRYDWNIVIEMFEALFLEVVREGAGHRRQ